MEALQLGFNYKDLNFSLTNNTSPNDFCTSFHFKCNGEHFLLWVGHQEPEYREDPDSPRYAISYALNEGNDESPEIYSDLSKDDLFQTNSADELIKFINGFGC